MMATQAVLFDLDGTLLDTAPEFTHCLNVMLAEQGKIPVVVEELRKRVSFGANGMLEFGFGFGEENLEFSVLKQRFLDLYAANLGRLTQIFPGIIPLLTQMNALNMPWAIVTNKPKAFAFPLIEKFPGLKDTPCLIAGDSLPVQKPDPAPLLQACELLEVDPRACWYVGDAIADVQASRRAGMRCAVANYGYIPLDVDPLSWEADRYLSNPDAIASLII